MADDLDFDKTFLALTGNEPFPWQREMYDRMVTGNPPKSCQIPTGLGKTSIMAIWLIARAKNPGPYRGDSSTSSIAERSWTSRRRKPRESETISKG